MTSAERSPASSASNPAGAVEVLTTPTWVYHVCRIGSRAWFTLMFPPRVKGLEHLPRTGGIVLAANHQSYLDIPLLSFIVPRHVCYVARDTLANWRWLAWVMRRCGAVLVQRGKGDRAALREMVAHLEAGDCVMIFPEGTRTPDGRMQPFKAGALRIARMAGVPIVPCAIRGTRRAWGKGQLLPRFARLSVEFAAPVDSAAENALEEVERAIAVRVGEP